MDTIRKALKQSLENQTLIMGLIINIIKNSNEINSNDKLRLTFNDFTTTTLDQIRISDNIIQELNKDID